MARAFADIEGRMCGLTSEPEVIVHQISCDDKAIIVGSDGVFEYQTNEEIAQIVMRFYDKLAVKNACEAVVNRAVARWKQVLFIFQTKTRIFSKQNSLICDDITCVVAFL